MEIIVLNKLFASAQNSTNTSIIFNEEAEMRNLVVKNMTEVSIFFSIISLLQHDTKIMK